jgi:hypothetical protein
MWVSDVWYWDQSTPGAADIYIEWSFDHGSFPVGSIQVWLRRQGDSGSVLLVTVPGNYTDYWHNAAGSDSSERLYYKLRYVNDSVVGPFSEELLVVPYVAPSAPSSLVAESSGSAVVSLSWSMAGVVNESGCSIEGRMDSDPFSELDTTGPGEDSRGIGLPQGGNWEFRVRAFNSMGYSDYSNTVQIAIE